MMPALARLLNNADVMNVIIGDPPFPQEYVNLTTPFCLPPVRPPLWQAGKLMAYPLVNPREVQEHIEWRRKYSRLRRVNKLFCAVFTERLFEKLWLGHPSQLQALLNISQATAALVKHVRVEIPWILAGDGGLELYPVTDGHQGLYWDRRERDPLPSVVPVLTEGELGQVVGPDKVIECDYIKLIGSFPNLKSFDNGFTGLSETTCFMPSALSFQAFNCLPPTIRVLKISIWLGASVLLEYLICLPLLEVLSLSVVERLDCGKEDRMGHPCSMTMLPNVQKLSVTAHDPCPTLWPFLENIELPKMHTLAMRLWGLLDPPIRPRVPPPPALENFFRRNGRHVKTLEYSCGWPSLRCFSDLMQLCPRVETLLIDWCDGAPVLVGSRSVEKLYLWNSGGLGRLPLNWPGFWGVEELVKAVLENKERWPNLEVVRDFNVYQKGANFYQFLDGLMRWEGYTKGFEGKGVNCYDRFGGRIQDLERPTGNPLRLRFPRRRKISL